MTEPPDETLPEMNSEPEPCESMSDGCGNARCDASVKTRIRREHLPGDGLEPTIVRQGDPADNRSEHPAIGWPEVVNPEQTIMKPGSLDAPTIAPVPASQTTLDADAEADPGSQPAVVLNGRVLVGTGIARPEALPVPVAANDEERSLERSPTLMAGASPASQGKVLVWGPSGRLMQAGVANLAAATFLFLWFCQIIHSGLNPLFFLFLALWLLALRTVWRPCYVTTDGAGIAITTWRGSRAVRWTDIESMEIKLYLLEMYGPYLELHAPDRLDINLGGYPISAATHLQALISRRAKLQPDSLNRMLFRKAPEAIEAMKDEGRGMTDEG